MKIILLFLQHKKFLDYILIKSKYNSENKYNLENKYN
jgi:hypothetical protein